MKMRRFPARACQSGVLARAMKQIARCNEKIEAWQEARADWERLAEQAKAYMSEGQEKAGKR